MSVSPRPLRDDDLARLAAVFAVLFASHGHIRNNPAGAHGLYSSLGFEPWRGAVTWEKPRF